MRTAEYSAQELFDQLNDTDEVVTLEAKSVSRDSSRSLMETICSFSNEPGLGGGVIILGIAENETPDGPRYVVEGVPDPDRQQLNIANQCKGMFNRPVYPTIKVEKIDGRAVIRVTVAELPFGYKPLYFKAELPFGYKPLYFKKDGLPQGAYRRIGSADLRCTAEDIGELFADPTLCYDATPVRGATLADVDPLAVKRYQDLRRAVNPAAEELSYGTSELLESLQCVNPDDPNQLNIAGLLLFGTQKALRRFMPMARVDYIRVPGTEWIENPDESFRSIDMRGSLLLLAYRLIDAINADLPRGFLLTDKLQADSVGLPVKVLREAIVNALMHGSYREGRPVQVIRYDNRIEIINAGYSLKPEDQLGNPGSVPRNRTIAPVFHDTNLAETKGSGIKRMRKLMADAHLASPTYESDREGNKFTLRLLLHHFLGEEDLAWLGRFARFELDDAQKAALIFLRESGAVDNSAVRQLSGCETLQASSALRKMRDLGLIVQKGKARATYYEAGPEFQGVKTDEDSLEGSNSNLEGLGSNLEGLSSSLEGLDLNLEGLGSNLEGLSSSLEGLDLNLEGLQALEALTKGIGLKLKRSELIVKIAEICKIRPFTRLEIARIINRHEAYLKPFLKEMVKKGILSYTIPEMSNNPHQAYKTIRMPHEDVKQGLLEL